MHASLTDVTIHFGDLVAVDRVSLSFRPGEVHALVGENGAGKTTAMNALFGLVRPVAGSVEVDGRPVAWSSPQEAIAAGLGMVHQHFMLQEEMSVLENVILCGEPAGRLGFVDFSAARYRLSAIAGEHGISLDPDMPVGRLSLGQRQTVEILKMLYRGADLVILDEPTSVLTPLEKDRLFDVLRGFRAGGRAIVLVTHKLDEVMELADHVSVMRGGRLVSSLPIGATDKARIAREIVGGELAPARPRAERAPGQAVLELSGLALRGTSGDIGPLDFRVHAGEIVGIAGVSGNGQAELVEALVGLRPVREGTIRIDGRDATRLDVADRRALGMSYVPEDRQRVGLALEASIAENASVGRVGEPGFRRGPLLVHAAMRRYAQQLIERFRIRVAGPRARASTMSGGNKQKLVVGRELSRETPLLIVENPTWGVDIGAIEFIHGELVRMRDAGHAILLVSSELDEILALSDRILVMFGGMISGEVDGRTADRDRVGALMVSRGAAGVKEAA